MVSASIAAYVLIHSWDSRWFGESEFVVDRSLETLIAGNVCIVYFSHYVRRKSPQWRLWIQILARPWSNSGQYSFNATAGVSSSAFGASFAIAGPDMLSIISGEARDPRRVMPIAFRTVFVWLFVFFILSTLAVGIVISSEDKILLNSIKNNGAGAAQSPYGASMMRLKIKRLPHLVNASITTSNFSAGSAFFFNSLRTLHGLAVQGFGPVIFKRVNRNGVPYATIFVTTAFACLSYLKIGNGSSKVLDWFIDGNWDIADFFFTYFSPICFVVLGVGYSVIKKEGLVSPDKADFFTEMKEIDEHENSLLAQEEEKPFSAKKAINWIL
ncbi:hypothetical protein E3P78_04142 [Wallemia ichthyophaga]|nr:hypothetical protein E3P78_04142 [Wallemia ichthyophaga]